MNGNDQTPENQPEAKRSDRNKITEAIRMADDRSDFEKAMEKSLGFHRYYEGTFKER